jgi:hypothetical protein
LEQRGEQRAVHYKEERAQKILHKDKKEDDLSLDISMQELIGIDNRNTVNEATSQVQVKSKAVVTPVNLNESHLNQVNGNVAVDPVNLDRFLLNQVNSNVGVAPENLDNSHLNQVNGNVGVAPANLDPSNLAVSPVYLNDFCLDQVNADVAVAPASNLNVFHLNQGNGNVPGTQVNPDPSNVAGSPAVNANGNVAPSNLDQVNGSFSFLSDVAITEALNGERQTPTYISLRAKLLSPTDFNDPNEVYIDHETGTRKQFSGEKLLRTRISRILQDHMAKRDRQCLDSDDLFAILILMGDNTQWYHSPTPFSLEDRIAVYGIAMTAKELIEGHALNSVMLLLRVEVIKTVVVQFVHHAMAAIGLQQMTSV